MLRKTPSSMYLLLRNTLKQAKPIYPIIHAHASTSTHRIMRILDGTAFNCLITSYQNEPELIAENIKEAYKTPQSIADFFESRDNDLFYESILNHFDPLYLRQIINNDANNFFLILDAITRKPYASTRNLQLAYDFLAKLGTAEVSAIIDKFPKNDQLYKVLLILHTPEFANFDAKIKNTLLEKYIDTELMDYSRQSIKSSFIYNLLTLLKSFPQGTPMLMNKLKGLGVSINNLSELGQYFNLAEPKDISLFFDNLEPNQVNHLIKTSSDLREILYGIENLSEASEEINLLKKREFLSVLGKDKLQLLCPDDLSLRYIENKEVQAIIKSILSDAIPTIRYSNTF